MVGTRAVAAFTVAAFAVAACGATDPEPGSAPDGTPSRTGPRTVDRLAATAPIDLIVDIGPDGWPPQYGDGAGIAVTVDNWAEAYDVTEEVAADEIAAAQRNGWRAAATEVWSNGDFTERVRLTIRQYVSWADVENPSLSQTIDDGEPPAGVVPPDGIALACKDRGPTTLRTGETFYFTQCVALIGDTTYVLLSSSHPDEDVARTHATDGIGRWLDAVTG